MNEKYLFKKYQSIIVALLIIIFSAIIYLIFLFRLQSIHSSQIFNKNKISIEKKLASNAVQKKYAAISFDDGPYGEPTKQIIAILQAKKIPATFFLMGDNVEKYPEIARAEFKAGFTIGNHTWDHSKFLFKQTTSTIADNLRRTDDEIEKIIGVRSHLFRPPYGYVSPALKEAASSTGHRLVMWNVAPHDYLTSCDADCIVTTVLEQARGIKKINIDLHDGRDVMINFPRDNVVAAVPRIIDELQKQGYEFVTIDQLLNVEAYQ